MKLVKTTYALIVSILILSLLTSVQTFAVEANTDLPPMSAELLDQHIRDYIMNHPEVVVEAIQKWQAQQKAAQNQQAAAVLEQRKDEIFNDPNSAVTGNPDGSVTVVEFMDYNCGYCRKVFPALTQLIENDANVRMLYKEFPVLGAGSEFAARAALAAREQDLYEEFHNAMMQSNQRITEKATLTIAEQVGLNVEQLKKDMQNPDYQKTIERNRRLAAALAINGTPGFIIGDEIVRGATSLDHLKQLIAKAQQ